MCLFVCMHVCMCACVCVRMCGNTQRTIPAYLTVFPVSDISVHTLPEAAVKP